MEETDWPNIIRRLKIVDSIEQDELKTFKVFVELDGVNDKEILLKSVEKFDLSEIYKRTHGEIEKFLRLHIEKEYPEFFI